VVGHEEGVDVGIHDEAAHLRGLHGMESTPSGALLTPRS
jgi:hypothetical protein